MSYLTNGNIKTVSSYAAELRNWIPANTPQSFKSEAMELTKDVQDTSQQ